MKKMLLISGILGGVVAIIGAGATQTAYEKSLAWMRNRAERLTPQQRFRLEATKTMVDGKLANERSVLLDTATGRVWILKNIMNEGKFVDEEFREIKVVNLGTDLSLDMLAGLIEAGELGKATEGEK